MRVLVACEFSGIVRDAFSKRGHYAMSCDLLPSECPGLHHQGDVLELIRISQPFDLMIAHPPCTFLSVSGNRWMKERPERGEEREKGLEFVRSLMSVSIPKVCIENPKSVITSRIRKADQIIQPWQFGHGETKETHLWLKGLLPLQQSNVVDGRLARIHRNIGPGPNRQRECSRTYQGIAVAMADQWG